MEPIVIQYNKSTVKNINSDLIQVIDDNGMIHTIKCVESTESWIRYAKEQLGIAIDTSEPLESTCVAVTHKTLGEMYIHLCAAPDVLLVFAFSLRLLQPGKEFDRVKALIRTMGWRTYDAS